MITNRKKYFNSFRIWAALLAAQILLFYMLSKSEKAVEMFSSFFEWQKNFHQKVFSHLPFSVGDIFYITVIFLLLFLIVKSLIGSSKRKAQASIFIVLNVLFFLYQIFWGMLYYQRPLIESLSKGNVTNEEAKRLTWKYLNLCKEHRPFVDESQQGIFHINDIKNLEYQILKEQKNMPRFLNQKEYTGIHSIKECLLGTAMSYTGISGYYNPFTAEAQYNPNLPSTILPFTMAHESAHQLGYAREQEASFIAFLIAKESKDYNLRYSTEYTVLKSLLRRLTYEEPDFCKVIVQHFTPAMLRDLRYEEKFNEEHSGIASQFFGITNNIFLKSNQQEGSVTYSYFLDLLIRYERTKYN